MASGRNRLDHRHRSADYLSGGCTQPERRAPPRRVATRVGMDNAMILIVDDEPSALVMLEMVLQKDHHVVCRAKSGRDALRLLANGGDENCSLVITDIRMPDRKSTRLNSSHVP
jgi:PleD family two-component response regulator